MLKGLLLVYFQLLIAATTVAQEDTVYSFIERSPSAEIEADRIINHGGRLLYNAPQRLPELARRANHLAGQLKNKRLNAAAYNLRAIYARHLGKLDSSVYYHQRSLQLLRDLPDHIQLAREYNHLSITYHDMGEYAQYLAYNDSAIVQARTAKDMGYVRLLLNNRAFVQLQLGDTTATLSLLKGIVPEIEDNPGLKSATLGNIARIYLMKKDYDSTLYFLNESLKYARIGEDYRTQATALMQLGVLYFQMEDLESAQRSWRDAYIIFQELNDLAGKLRAKGGKVKILARQGRKQQAQALIDSIRMVCKQNDLHMMRMELIEEEIWLYEEFGDYASALSAYKELSHMEDSIGQAEIKQQIAELETKFQAREREQELIALKKDQELEKARNEQLYTILITTVLVLLMLIAFLRIRYRSRQKIAEKERARLNAEVARRHLEEQKLRDEIELKSKQLTSKALSLSERNELLNRLLEQLQQGGGGSKVQRSEVLRNVEREIKINIRNQAEWKEFNTFFEEVNTGFTEALKFRYPNLSSREVRLLALTKLGLNTKEISNLLHIAPDSVKMARYRLKKKLNLTEEETLESFLQKLQNGEAKSA